MGNDDTRDERPELLGADLRAALGEDNEEKPIELLGYSELGLLVCAYSELMKAEAYRAHGQMPPSCSELIECIRIALRARGMNPDGEPQAKAASIVGDWQRVAGQGETVALVPREWIGKGEPRR